MPELPEVQTVLDGVANELKGKEIRGLDCFYPGTVVRDPELPGQVFPAKFLSHRRRGKYMILELEGGISVIIHLRMTGKLVTDEAMTGTSTHERACFLLSGLEKLHFIDIRTFGKIVLCKTDNLGKFMPELGVEPLSAEFGGAYLGKVLKGRKTPIKNALLDQRLIAGLGNIYACEILFRAKLDPRTPAGQLSLPKLRKLAAETKAVLREAISMNGTSISDFRRVDDKTGQFQHFLRVYQKELCPKGHKIAKIKQGGRGTFYCPVCQK
ncbi:MAG TPA: bifunctional DNA-formamidopyrimidine glycosylase/DNA-(apurinic or apyrimidinic site) lyase [Candidatus Syntrophosphaera sp.]|nr:bifunctional DNA-formamidopyrimidine glycosylase/DNA-(apurinic or apyrimidinic site) lyase [Candidatus Syntrophosphaera sp.]HPH61149.1 bifunctional DNA-formamidopyrimidine glycosylase/DNA-(apurinic or apyrimidinic site) lyase [Candidatus Syntrophosphaera sp.]